VRRRRRRRRRRNEGEGTWWKLFGISSAHMDS
jgi:hypothetical protein